MAQFRDHPVVDVIARAVETNPPCFTQGNQGLAWITSIPSFLAARGVLNSFGKQVLELGWTQATNRIFGRNPHKSSFASVRTLPRVEQA
jgi:hypothetical protein